MNKKILIVTPNVLIPTHGACEQDRIEGILQLKRLGFDVQVLGKIFSFQSKENIEAFSKVHEVPFHVVPYRYNEPRNLFQNFFYYFKRLIHPSYWDGSVYEYADPSMCERMEEVLQAWKPDIVWFDYTFMLPLYRLARRHGSKIITHSLIYDPKNILEEEGRTLKNYIRAGLKTITDIISIKRSDYFFAIAPDEKRMYERLGAKKIALLPLRALYHLLGKNKDIRDRSVLNVFFLGSSYHIKHNLGAAAFIINEIVPRVQKLYQNKFRFFITGGKLPEDLEQKCSKQGISYVGFVENLDSFLADMDIALIPSLFGTGMQQKIFEPLTRGFPTITSTRGLGDYPFETEKEILAAETADEFVAQLGGLLDVEKRRVISSAALEKSKHFFSREVSDRTVKTAIAAVVRQ